MNNSFEYLNTSVVCNADSSCMINCPWCSFWVKNRNETKKLEVTEIKKRIDFAIETIPPNGDLILLPWNVLLDYSISDLEEILLHWCSKWVVVQWELEKIDEKILWIFESEIIKKLLNLHSSSKCTIFLKNQKRHS